MARENKSNEEKYPSLFSRRFFSPFISNFDLFDEGRGNNNGNWPLESLSEDQNNVYVEVSMPGMSAEDINITLENGELWVSANKENKTKDSKRKYYYESNKNISYRVSLPGNIDDSQTPKASYKEGVLEVVFPKVKKETPKRIPVSKK